VQALSRRQLALEALPAHPPPMTPAISGWLEFPSWPARPLRPCSLQFAGPGKPCALAAKNPHQARSGNRAPDAGWGAAAPAEGKELKAPNNLLDLDAAWPPCVEFGYGVPLCSGRPAAQVW